MLTYDRWESLCRSLDKSGIHSVSAESLLQCTGTNHGFLVFKHDVETNPKKALDLAHIEHRYGHIGSYYVQQYILHHESNIRILKRIQSLGHEVSYHHDVLDANHGNLDDALLDFKKNMCLFQSKGFPVRTVCQHGNPLIMRTGYTSNRDFFRSPTTTHLYPNIYDIMVNYKSAIGVDYTYVSDAGYGWRIINDPEHDDMIIEDNRCSQVLDMNGLLCVILENKNVIVSTHPHRWSRHRLMCLVRALIFKCIKWTAIRLWRISIFKRLFQRLYGLAKHV